MSLKFNYENAILKDGELEHFSHLVKASSKLLKEKSGAGNDYLGWIDYPEKYDKEEFERILKAAEKIKKNSEVFLTIGIGGSYLGARAAINALTNNFYNESEDRKGPKIYYVGNNISGTYLKDLYDLVKDKDISVNIISKSGTTTEPAIAFRIFKKLLEEKYGKNGAKERIFATTDKNKGALRKLADAEGYESFVIQDDIGGRFSVLTAVGLLPMAVAGIDIEEIMKGAKSAQDKYANENFEENDCNKYAAIRNILYRKGKVIEIMTNYTPELVYFSEWWKQLYAESEGKEGKSIFPASVTFTTDLHSLGQMIQDGKRNIFETNILISKQKKDVLIESDEKNLDGLNYLAGKKLSEVNRKAFEATMAAHVYGNVPNLVLEMEELNAFNIGELFYFFEKACGISGYLLGLNPFNQPGVELYKSNMFKLLGKPGY